MKYTEEDIKKFKNDPFVKLLQLLSGADIDKVLEDIEKENDGEGNLHWSPDTGTVKEKPNEKEVLKRVDEHKYPIDSATLLGIIQMMIDAKKSVVALEKQGFNIETVNAYNQLFCVIVTILRAIYGDAAYILTDVGPDDVAKHVLIEFEANLHE